MNHVKRFGFAVGSVGGLLCLGSVLVILIAGHDNAVRFFNRLLHGLDVSSVVRMDMPFGV